MAAGNPYRRMNCPDGRELRLTPRELHRFAVRELRLTAYWGMRELQNVYYLFSCSFCHIDGVFGTAGEDIVFGADGD